MPPNRPCPTAGLRAAVAAPTTPSAAGAAPAAVAARASAAATGAGAAGAGVDAGLCGEESTSICVRPSLAGPPSTSEEGTLPSAGAAAPTPMPPMAAWEISIACAPAAREAAIQPPCPPCTALACPCGGWCAGGAPLMCSGICTSIAVAPWVGPGTAPGKPAAAPHSIPPGMPSPGGGSCWGKLGIVWKPSWYRVFCLPSTYRRTLLSSYRRSSGRSSRVGSDRGGTTQATM